MQKFRSTPEVLGGYLALLMGLALYGCGRERPSPTSLEGVPEYATPAVLPRAAASVTVTDLGLLPGGYASQGWAVNNLGQVTGVAMDGTGNLAAIWSGGTIITAGGWNNGPPEAINDSRQVVGTLNEGSYNRTGMFWDASGQVSILPPIPGGLVARVFAHDINASGAIVGRSRDASFLHHAVLWQGATFVRDLGFMGSGDYSEAWGINDQGDIVGAANTVSMGSPHGFLWRNGSFTDLGSLAGPSGTSTARDINNSGLIAGSSNGGIAVVWRNGVIETLPALPGGTVYNTVTDLNNNGDVVGYGQSPSGVHLDTPILWRGGVAIDLGRWPGGTFARAYGINDNGQIVGEGNLVDGGPVHALMWTVGAPPPTNATPTVTLVATSPTTISPGGSVSVRGSFTDPDGGPWTYTFDWGNGTTSGTAAAPGSILATRRYSVSGRYKVTLRVTDARGAMGKSADLGVRVR